MPNPYSYPIRAVCRWISCSSTSPTPTHSIHLAIPLTPTPPLCNYVQRSDNFSCFTYLYTCSITYSTLIDQYNTTTRCQHIYHAYFESRPAPHTTCIPSINITKPKPKSQLDTEYINAPSSTSYRKTIRISSLCSIPRSTPSTTIYIYRPITQHH